MTRRAGIVIVNTGDGKGKSTAAFGVMMRAVARGWRVAVVQFIKSGRWNTGERSMAERLGVEWIVGGDGFTWESDDMDATARAASEAWDAARSIIESGEHELVILDEATYPLTFGWIQVADVIEVIEQRPEKTNIVITGRGASEELISVADTVTEMRKVKHVFDTGVPARRGLDY